MNMTLRTGTCSCKAGSKQRIPRGSTPWLKDSICEVIWNIRRKVDISDLDFSEVSRYPVSEDEIRVPELHDGYRGPYHRVSQEYPVHLRRARYRHHRFLELLGLRGVLSQPRAGRVSANAAGRTSTRSALPICRRRASVHEWIESRRLRSSATFSRHFHGVYLTWGAISELTTLEGYGVLASRTRNPLLAELLRRLAKDERRHFAFYYAKAREQLTHPSAQRLNRFVIKHFWLPVGGGVKPD